MTTISNYDEATYNTKDVHTELIELASLFADLWKAVKEGMAGTQILPLIGNMLFSTLTISSFLKINLEFAIHQKIVLNGKKTKTHCTWIM